MVILIGALIAACGAGVGFVWRQQRNRFFEEQYRSAETLRGSEEKYRTTMMSVGDGVVATDTEGRVEMLNPVAETLTGWRQGKLAASHWRRFFELSTKRPGKPLKIRSVG